MHMWGHLVDSAPEAHLEVKISKVPHAYVLHILCIIYIYIYLFRNISSKNILIHIHNSDRQHWDNFSWYYLMNPIYHYRRTLDSRVFGDLVNSRI